MAASLKKFLIEDFLITSFFNVYNPILEIIEATNMCKHMVEWIKARLIIEVNSHDDTKEKK